MGLGGPDLMMCWNSFMRQPERKRLYPPFSYKP